MTAHRFKYLCMFRTLFTIFFALYFFTGGYAQKYYTLEACINIAYENNINISQGKLRTLAVMEDVKQSKAAMLPSLSGSSSVSHIGGRVVDPYTNQYSTREVWTNISQLDAGITLFSGLQLRNTYRQMKYEHLAGQSDVDKAKDQLAFNITFVYLQILLSQELLKSFKNQLLITGSLYEKSEKQFGKGVLLKGALLDLAAQQAAEESSVLNVENQLKLLYIDLRDLMGLRPDEQFEIVAPQVQELSTLAAEDPEEIYNRSLDFIPGIKSARYRILSAEKFLSVTHGLRSPVITLNASAGTLYANTVKKLTGSTLDGVSFVGMSRSKDSVFTQRYSPVYSPKSFAEQFKDNFSKGIGAGVYIPILNNMKARSSIAKAQIGLKIAENDLQLQKNELRKSIYKAHSDLEGSERSYHSAGKVLHAQEEAYKNAEARFEYGVITSYEYYQVKNRYVKAQSDLLQSKYDYLFKQKILNYYKGIPFSL